MREGTALPIEIHKSMDGLTVELEGVVTIRHAQDGATRISEALDGCVSVTVVTGRLKDVDTSILQLLCSLRKTVPMISFENPSDEFLAAVDRCGLRHELLGGNRDAR